MNELIFFINSAVFLKYSRILKTSSYFNKAHILELYSGTGSFGLECLSRQANKIYFVEKNKSIINILKKARKMYLSKQ